MVTPKIRYGFFVGSITLSILCFFFVLVKYVFRIPLTPTTTFWILAVSPVLFYIRSEWLFQDPKALALAQHVNARNASVVLLVGLLVFYIFPPLFQLLLFPKYSSTFFHYPQHALIALGIGLLLIRLHALGGGVFLVFLGVVTEIVALFFLGTRTPEWIFGEIPIQSPGKTFEFFSLVAIFLSYFVLFTTNDRGFTRKALIKFGHIEDELWGSLRRFLFPLLWAISHFLFCLTLIYPDGQRFIGIIFLLLAGLWIYTGHSFQNAIFYSFAYIESVTAIFSCRFFGAYWQETWIIWLLLGLFILLMPVYSLFLKERYEYAMGSFYLWSTATAILVFYEHITFYGIQSKWGVVALFILWLVTFCVPVGMSARTHPLFKTFLSVLVYCPAFFFFLLQGEPSIEHIPFVVLIAVAISCLIVAYRVYNWQWLSNDDPSTSLRTGEVRIAHHLHWFLMEPYSLVPVFFCSTLAVLAIHILNYFHGPELFANQLFPMVIVQGVLAVYWFDLARKTRLWWWTIAAEAMILGVILTLRQEIPLLLNLPWEVNWDMAIGLFAAFTITALRPLLKGQDKSIRIPIRYTLFGLPLVTVMHAIDYGVGFETLYIVILLYSILFTWQAYSEKDRFVLAYCFLGYNSFFILMFLHQERQSLQWYITPVCLSILILVQIFRDMTTRTTANFVRGVTLLILLGTAMFQAVIENSLSPTHHLILLFLSISAIVAAGYLRIQIFVISGIFCFIVDIIAIIYIVLSRQETETLKVILGLGLTLGGGLILAVYILYRKNKEWVERFVERMKKTFYSWE
jgi:hypothetical protein